ncbi:MAG TPA: serine hydrolase, partial [Saprospiraceae bacterium]|nr:serine hydrolase [Saprospiraceae bacterium]
YVYSDLGFILLAEIVEVVSGTRIDRFVRNNFYIPMGLNSTHFNPYGVGRWISDRVPPTEIDTTYGRGIVKAYVHDERAYFMDGIAGHAGLFSSSTDIAKLAQLFINKGLYAGRRYLSEETVEQFTSKQSKINNRGFGFDRKSEGFSTAGTFTSMNTFGHLGFTGTSLWIDPDQDLAIILLTNRTFPNRSYGSTISKIRNEIANILSKSIIHE